MEDLRFESIAEAYEKGFTQGYEKGKEETITKACELLDITDEKVLDEFAKDLRKAIEEELSLPIDEEN